MTPSQLRPHSPDAVGTAEIALSYARHGWPVLPLRPQGKAPDGRVALKGWRDATSDPVKIREWWPPGSRRGIGIALQPSGLVAIDFDPRSGGDDALYEQEQLLGKLPRTVTSKTGGGGSHTLLQAPPQLDPVREIARGVEVKYKGYIVAAPSIHPNGRPYEWDDHPDEVEVAGLLPAWLHAITKRPAVTEERGRRPPTHDPLKCIPAAAYVAALTGRRPNRQGFVRCPFHADGNERTPSLKLYPDNGWACYGCDPLPGQTHLAGDIYTFASLCWGFSARPRGDQFRFIAAHLRANIHLMKETHAIA